MRKAIIIFSSFFVLTICGCSLKNDNNKEQENSGSPDLITHTTYDEIYKYEYRKSQIKIGAVLYRASDGYIDNKMQGYNNFYYLAKKDNEYNKMIFEEGQFVYHDSFINNDIMKSAANNLATRAFLCPLNGKVKISGSAFNVKGEDLHISIYKNNDLILHKIVDNDGVYHEDFVNVNKRDILYFVLDGNGEISYNPVIDYSLADEVNLHHAADGYYGDVHPFYDKKSGKMYMFYLSTGNQSGAKHQRYESMLTTSCDFIHYDDEAIGMDDKSRPEQDLYFVLNVFEDKSGCYRSAAGFGAHSTTSKSVNLHTWTNGTEQYVDPEDHILKYYYAFFYDSDVYAGRDPDMFYSSEDDTYYSVVLNYLSSLKDKGPKSLSLYMGNGEGLFSTKATKLVHFDGRGDCECPQIKKIGNRWYIFYSVFGSGTKGNVGKLAYRIGDENVKPQNVNWEQKPELYLDGEDLHAAQIIEVRDKLYYYGWLNYSYNENVWGGYLNLPHEVYQESDGSLRTRLDEKLLSLLNKGIIYKDNNHYTSNQVISINLDRNLITCDIDLKTNSNGGLVLTHGSDEYFAGIEQRGSKMFLVLKNSFDGYMCQVEAKDETKYHLTIALDDCFVDLNVNDNTTLSAVTNLGSSTKRLSVCSNGNEISNLKIFKLADYNNIYF